MHVQFQSALQIAHNLAAEMINDALRDLERSLRGSKNISFKRGRSMPKVEVNEVRETPDLTMVDFSCCAFRAKIPLAAAEAVSYCAYCGNVRV